MINGLISLRDYKKEKIVNKKLIAECSFGQGIMGKIIETELDPFVNGKTIQGIKLESNIALHTLRINLGEDILNVGENDIVIHMAKEALKALELTPLDLPNYKEPGYITKFRQDVKIECFRREEDNKELGEVLDLALLEKGISGRIVDSSLGKILDGMKYSDITGVFPSWYYEDWIQIHFRNRELILRMDPGGLYGMGIGKINKSTTYNSKKEDMIFCWTDWMNYRLDKYYGEILNTELYENRGRAKIEITPKEN